jgi:hypothetical protein
MPDDTFHIFVVSAIWICLKIGYNNPDVHPAMAIFFGKLMRIHGNFKGIPY